MTATYAVRLLGSDGTYPWKPLVIEPFGGLALDEFPWCAVRVSDRLPASTDVPPGDYPVGSISWLQPQEIRFLAAATLAEAHPRTWGRLRIYTRSWHSELRLEEPVTASRLVEESRVVASDLFRRATGVDECGDLVYTPDPLRRNYTAEARGLLERMDVTDSLLHRGLYKLLIATELRRYSKFLEESALAALISREAALELLRRRLSAQGGQRLRLEDVLSHIAETFPTGEPFVEVLQTDWNARVMMAHPVSEHGEYWSPPVEVEDCFDALHTLTYLYRYLLLDEVWEPTDAD